MRRLGSVLGDAWALARPYWSSEERGRALYVRLREGLPAAAVLSIAHRDGVARFHDRALRLRDGRLAPMAE